MTHIDPFAPATSPQHPSRWRHDPHGTMDLGEILTASEDAMVPWLVLDNEPVSMDNPDAAIIGQARWEEYRQLLDEYGTQEQRDRMLARTPLLADEDMPTLAELRQKNETAKAALTGVTAEVKASPTPSAADDLAAKLAALEDAGL